MKREIEVDVYGPDCNIIITSYSPWVEIFNDVTPEIETKVHSLSPRDFST